MSKSEYVQNQIGVRWCFYDFVKFSYVKWVPRTVAQAITLESGINIAPWINVAYGKFGKKNKRSPIYTLYYLYY